MTRGKGYRCELLGRFRLYGPDGNEVRIPIAKGVGLIAYLLLSGEGSAPRSHLTALLWSERSEAAARTALRQCLHQMKSRLDAAVMDLIVISKDSIRLADVEVETDISTLARHGFLEGKDSQQLSFDRLLYGLEDLDPSFSEWLHAQRRTQKAQLCKDLTRQLEQARDDGQRMQVAETLHQLDPSLEVAARPLIEHNIRIGNIVGLLSVYKRLWDALDEQWEEEPSQEMQKLVGNARALFGETMPALSDTSTARQSRRYGSILTARVVGPAGQKADATDQATQATFLKAAEPLLEAAGAVLLPGETDTLVALFGYPKANEDDAATAITAALDLKQAFADRTQDQGAQLFIGLDSGLIDMAQNETAPGTTSVSPGTIFNTKNLVLHNEGLAPIQATARMVRRLEHLFECQPLRANADRDLVSIIGHRPQPFAPIVTKASDLIGRIPFIAALRTAWDQAQSEGMQTICLQGPPGIGKTRLAHEFLRDMHHEMPALAVVRCNRYDRSAPLEPVYNLLKVLTDQPTEAITTPAALLSQLTEALYDRSGVLFVDDWHWVDDASRAVFQDLAMALQDQPILLMLAARDTSLDDGLVRTSHQVHVPPLNAKEAQRRAEQVLGYPIDATLKSEIFEKSGGNPLYLEEICSALTTMERLETREQMSKAFAPDLHALIASRIDQFDVEDTQVIFAIAVHGETVDQDLLAQVLGYKVPQARLDRLCARDLLRLDVSGQRLQFKHGITCDVAYGMIPPAHRTELHASYYKAISAEAETHGAADYVEKLALHAQASGMLIEAIEFAEQAGDKALAASSLDQAQRQFHTALSLIEELDQASDWKARWLSIALRWARPCVYAASADHLPILERAQATAVELRDDAKLAEVLYWTGYNLIVQGEYARAMDHLQRAQAIAKGLGLARLETEIKAILGYAFTLKAQYDTAEPYISTAIGVKDQHPVRKGHAPVTSVYARSILALIYAEQGKFDAAEDMLQTALARVSNFQHEIESSILTTGATVLLWRGRWDKAKVFTRRARQRSERVSAPYMIGTSRCLYCYSDWKATGSKDSLAELERTTYWLDTQGMRLFLTLILGWLSEALADAARFDDAAAVAARVLERTGESGECLGTSMACRTLARCAMAPGGDGVEAAADHLRAARYWADYRDADHERGACALLEAEIFAQAHRTEAAQKSIDEATSVFERLDMPAFEEKARAHDLARTHPVRITGS